MPFPPQQFLLIAIALAACLIYAPYMVVGLGRFKVGLDLHAPRALFDQLPMWAKRATWAHQNSFEVFMLFAAAALMVYVSGRASDSTTSLCITFLALRLAYSIFYITDIPIARSLCWIGNMTCIAGLMMASLGNS